MKLNKNEKPQRYATWQKKNKDNMAQSQIKFCYDIKI